MNLIDEIIPLILKPSIPNHLFYDVSLCIRGVIDYCIWPFTMVLVL